MRIAIFFILVLTALSARAENFSCPKTFRMVKTGDTIESVRAACGEPTSSTTRTASVNTPVEVVQWFYSVRYNNRDPRAQIPLFIVNFQNRKVVQVDKNSTFSPVLGTVSCAEGNMLKPGLSMEEVMLMCGSPTSTRHSEIMLASTKPLVILTYDQGQFHPKIHFEFDDGKLIHIKRN